VRIVAVIAEFGALCAVAAGEGVLEDVLRPLTLILREAGAAGVHVIIEDQVVDQRWPRGISANAEPVTGYLPQNYGAAGGYHFAHQLPAYAFHFGGTVFNTWPMENALPGLLARVQPPAAPIMNGERPAVPVTIEGEVLPLVERPERAVNVPAGTAAGTDDPGRWDDVVAAWFAAHPSALTGPAVGVSDLARAMCRDNEGGSDANYEAYKGRAHKLFHEFRAAVHLPSGDKLGVDTTSTSHDRRESRGDE